MNAPSVDDLIGESYLIKKYGLSREQAKRLLQSFGHKRADLERWLGSHGRTQAHRTEDMEQTTADLAFG